ncbi:MAG: cytochrome c3 family protein [Planctomycetes bacterium]|nr:cytochrome c3 family protein [Planctomycetota bacterium]
MFNKAFDRRIHIFLGCFMASATIGVAFGLYALWPPNLETGFEPQQPIEFSHALHAGVDRLADGRQGMGIPCLYCHSEATKGPHATVPPVDTCFKCHSQVEGKGPDGGPHPEIAKIFDAMESKKPIEWVKVNDVADFVYFDHSQHLLAGMDCTECHGDVQNMHRVKRDASLKMKWCLDCHTQAPTEHTSELYARQNLRSAIHCSACHR